ncbi:MAG: hypothetical protein HXX13_04690 [Bacteroidetes bacterium]|nr:hypothetical protein [Bacteroidota bacterium]
MKNKFTITLASLILLFAAVSAQDTLHLFSRNHPMKLQNSRNQENSSDEIRTITGRGHSNGFYIGFHSGYAQVNDYDALNIGTRLAWVANHGLAIGFAGTGFFSEPVYFTNSSSRQFNYSGGYGGLFIEPILFPKMPVHVSFPVIMGVGGIARSVFYDMTYPYETTDAYVESSEAFVILEPGAEIELNVARWLRFGLGCTYRFTQGFDQPKGGEIKDNPLDGLTTGFSIKLGKF